MRYRTGRRPDPRNPLAPMKYYAIPFREGEISETYLSEVVAGRASLTAGDVSSTLKNFLDEVPRLLLLGRTVRLDPFGIFRISFGSEGADTPEEVNANLIRKPRIVFTPSPQFKRKLEEITFEKLEL